MLRTQGRRSRPHTVRSSLPAPAVDASSKPVPSPAHPLPASLSRPPGVDASVSSAPNDRNTPNTTKNVLPSAPPSSAKKPSGIEANLIEANKAKLRSIHNDQDLFVKMASYIDQFPSIHDLLECPRVLSAMDIVRTVIANKSSQLTKPVPAVCQATTAPPTSDWSPASSSRYPTWLLW